ncbi:MAG: hypothetical protein AMXMBFR16_10470 [Candidatus Uhrbacteria bacterium]
MTKPTYIICVIKTNDSGVDVCVATLELEWIPRHQRRFAREHGGDYLEIYEKDDYQDAFYNGD